MRTRRRSIIYGRERLNLFFVNHLFCLQLSTPRHPQKPRSLDLPNLQIPPRQQEMTRMAEATKRNTRIFFNKEPV